MSLYTLALFLHICGAIGAWVSLGIWLFGLAALRHCRRVEQVRALAWLILLASPLMVMSVVLIGVAGFEMALSTWGLTTPWIAVSLVSVVLVGPLGAFVLDPRMRAIFAATRETPDGPLPTALFTQAHDPILVTTASTLASVLLGVVFLMTAKPPLPLSISVIAVAGLLGLIACLPLWMRARRRSDHRTPSVNRDEGDPFLKKTLWTKRW